MEDLGAVSSYVRGLVSTFPSYQMSGQKMRLWTMLAIGKWYGWI